MTTVHKAAPETMTERERELLDLLLAAQKLGLRDCIGSAYISRQYIDEQDALNKRINATVAKFGAA